METEEDSIIGEFDFDALIDDDQNQPGPSKRIKFGAAVYKTKYNPSWKKDYPFIGEVKGDPYKFWCTTCSRTVSCQHQGKRDVDRHVEKQLHQNNAKSLKSQTVLSFTSKKASSPIDHKVYLCINYIY